MKILAVDGATQCGLAFGEPGSVPVFDTVRFDGVDRLRLAASVIRWASRRLVEDLPDVAYIENPMPFRAVQGHSTSKTLVRLNTIYDIIGGALLLKGVRVVGYDIQQARQAFIGDGKLERDEAKARSKRMAHVLGWAVGSLDEADAAAGWYWACCCEAPRIAAVIHPGMHAKVASIALADKLAAHG
jgi:hypothetical protein